MSLDPDLLAGRLRHWDGRRRDVPLSVCEEFGSRPGIRDALVQMAADPDCADAATWCCKHLSQAQGLEIDAAALVSGISAKHGWAARLHVLQMLPDWSGPLPEEDLATLVESAIGSEKPMVRAWGYAGADILGQRFAARRSTAVILLAQARRRETAGSIHARLRRCSL